MYVNNNRPFQGAQGQNKGGGKGKKDRPVCTYCGFTRHIADKCYKCYKLHGYPPGYKPKGGNRSMVNQVAGPFGFDANNIRFPNVQSNVLPTQGVQSDGMIQNLVDAPFGAQTGFQNGVGNTSFGIAHGASGSSVGGSFLQQNPSSYQPQCPISPAQCEQLLSFVKGYAGSSSSLGFGTQTSHVASVMTPNAISALPQTPSSLPSPSNSASISSNFLGNPFWIPSNFSHSVFSAQVVEKTTFKSDSWIIDTSATDHMVHSMSQFTSITSIVNTYVYLPNGDQVLVTHVGIMHISSTFVLKDVLCVPSFAFNLISVSKLTKTSFCCLIFLGNCCFIQDLAQWSMIGQGRESNGLYLLDFSYQQRSTALTATTSPFSSIELWHTRLGHPSFSKLQLLKRVININAFNKTTCCDVCHFSKQKRLPFPISTHVSSAPFDLIHCDL